MRDRLKACLAPFRREQGAAVFEPSVEELLSLFEHPQEEPRLAFLHDPWCPVSRRAMAALEASGLEAIIVDVSSSNAIGRSIELASGIRHESPQVLLIRCGQVTWHASHSAIQAASLESALEEVQSQTSQRLQ